MNARAQTTTPAFQHGVSWGKKGIFRGNLCVEYSEEDVVEIIQSLIDFALEGHLTEEQLLQDIGIAVGFISANPALFQ